MAEALNQAARAAMARRDGAAARAAVSRMVAEHPSYAPGWLTASVLELELGQPGRALQAAERGLAVATGDRALLVQRVRCLHAAGYMVEARRAAASCDALLAGHAAMQRELAQVYMALGDYGAARRVLEQTVAAAANDAGSLRAMAMVLRFLGEFGAAETYLDRAIAVAPADWEAYPVRSQLRRQTPAQNHVAALEKMLAGSLPAWPGRVHIHYALAKEYEDLGIYDKSFDHLAAGAALYRATLRYDVAADIATMADIAAAIGPDILARGRNVAGDAAPIFVFGLPRSGTTLVDRILGCHPDVTSHGELNEFPMAVTACAGGGGSMADLIKRAAAVEPARIGSTYLARVNRMFPAVTRFIDKQPMNYLYAGWIAAALPGARLVHVTRNPMANGYGLFKTLFQQGYPFSYDLRELGQYMGAYDRLMAHWRTLLGDRLIEIRYENLVADQGSETRRLVAACGLDWNDACLAPELNTAPSLTQSAVQVRAPLNGDSVHQWRHFSGWLGALRDGLG